MKQDTNTLPNHRPEDYKIKLLKGKQALFVWNYKSLLEQKTEAMRKNIDKHLEKGFIKSSLLATATLMLLVRKPGGRIRFCVDYRALNKITVKN